VRIDPAWPVDPGLSDRHSGRAVRSQHRRQADAAELIATGAADVCRQHFRIETNDNLLASKHVIQVRMLMRSTDVLVVIVTAGDALMTFDQVRQYGVSLFASAGVAGIDGRLAARPAVSNSWRNHFKTGRRKHP